MKAELTTAGRGSGSIVRMLRKSTAFMTGIPEGSPPYPPRKNVWAFWSRNILINRYMDLPKPVGGNIGDILHRLLQS